MMDDPGPRKPTKRPYSLKHGVAIGDLSSQNRPESAFPVFLVVKDLKRRSGPGNGTKH